MSATINAPTITITASGTPTSVIDGFTYYNYDVIVTATTSGTTDSGVLAIYHEDPFTAPPWDGLAASDNYDSVPIDGTPSKWITDYSFTINPPANINQTIVISISHPVIVKVKVSSSSNYWTYTKSIIPTGTSNTFPISSYCGFYLGSDKTTATRYIYSPQTCDPAGYLKPLSSFSSNLPSPITDTSSSLKGKAAYYNGIVVRPTGHTTSVAGAGAVVNPTNSYDTNYLNATTFTGLVAIGLDSASITYGPFAASSTTSIGAIYIKTLVSFLDSATIEISYNNGSTWESFGNQTIYTINNALTFVASSSLYAPSEFPNYVWYVNNTATFIDLYNLKVRITKAASIWSSGWTIYDVFFLQTPTVYTEVATGGPGTPVITSFTATPSSVSTGGSSTLAWTITSGSSASISPTVGTVSPTTGSTSVSPATSTTYTLLASNALGSSSATATVTVGAGSLTYKPSSHSTSIVGSASVTDVANAYDSTGIRGENTTTWSSTIGLNGSITYTFAFSGSTVVTGNLKVLVFWTPSAYSTDVEYSIDGGTTYYSMGLTYDGWSTLTMPITSVSLSNIRVRTSEFRSRVWVDPGYWEFDFDRINIYDIWIET